VTAAGRLIDVAGRVIAIQDATAAIAIRLPAGAAEPSVGRRIFVAGTIGRAYGAPRMSATSLEDLGTGSPIPPLVISASPGAGHEWRVVRVSGVLTAVVRSGDSWRADLVVGGTRIAVAGVAGAGIPASEIVEGRRATIIGIVRRPYPSAKDRRYVVVPRSPRDVVIGAAPVTAAVSGDRPSRVAAPVPVATSPVEALDVDIAALDRHRGETVRIGGIVVEVLQDQGTIRIDDGTAIGEVALSGDAVIYLTLLAPGDALDATGVVAGDLVRVSRAAGIVRVDDLGAGDPLQPPGDSLANAAWPDLTGTVGLAVASGGPGSVVAADLEAAPGLGGSGSVGLGSLALVSFLSLALALLRRRSARRALGRRVAARLAAIATGPSAVRTPAGIPAVIPAAMASVVPSRALRTGDARSRQVDARSSAGLSSPEFRAREAHR